MKKTDISQALENVDERYIAESVPAKKQKSKKWLTWTSAVAAVLVVAIGAGALFGGGNVTVSAHAIETAVYPEMARYLSPSNQWMDNSPEYKNAYKVWLDGKKERYQYYGAGKTLGSFFEATVSEFLSGSDGKNLVYSPLNVYMALSMLAEITDGESRAQILELIGTPSIEALREQAYNVWNANYCDDGKVTSVLANSLWLNEKISYNEETLKTVAEKYFASSFSGTMGSEEYNVMLRNWLNEQTHGLLADKIKDISLNVQTVIALATTVYYTAKWDLEFSKQNTVKDVFHAASGDVTTSFMKQKMYYGSYFYGENFSAVGKELEDSGSMFFILPDEGVSIDDLLSSGEALSFIASGGQSANKKSLIINFSVPKFDVSSKTDLIAGLQNLGITDVFDSKASDFSSLTSDMANISVTKAEHSARVKIDEEGVEAAAYTVLAALGAGEPPTDEIDFAVDRPFIFVITSDDGLPMFVGVVNNVK